MREGIDSYLISVALVILSLAVLAIATPVAAQTLPAAVDERAAAMAAARERQNAIPDTPGTGKYPAIKEELPSLPDHVVYRPAQLGKLGSTKLGIYIFGNGACSNDGASARLHLLEIASHGYLAIAPGKIRSGPGAAAQPTEPRPAAPPPPPQDGSPKLPRPPTTSADLLSALDWALAQNADPKSPLFGKLDPAAVAISGFSCGGLQALQIASDSRVKTLIVMNSGIFNDATQDGRHVLWVDVREEAPGVEHLLVVIVDAGDPFEIRIEHEHGRLAGRPLD